MLNDIPFFYQTAARSTYPASFSAYSISCRKWPVIPGCNTCPRMILRKGAEIIEWFPVQCAHFFFMETMHDGR